MSRDASIEFDWADGTHRFRLAIGQLRELQEKTDAGPAWLYARIEAGMWLMGWRDVPGKPNSDGDLAETIRLGLIGGGMKPEPARRLVQRYVLDRPLHESIVPAQKILAAAIAGPEDEPLKKEPGAEATTESARSQMESSASQPSMETALS